MKHVVDNFAKRFIAQVDGSNTNIDAKELSGGVLIKQILYHDFKMELDKLDDGINPSDVAMITAIANGTGATGINSRTEVRRIYVYTLRWFFILFHKFKFFQIGPYRAG